MTLLAVPNVSEGRDAEKIARLKAAFAVGGKLLDAHSDSDHNRSVFTLLGGAGALPAALVSGGRAAVDEIDMREHTGVHPSVGALDVCPVVWLAEDERELARAEALNAAERIGTELEIPVFLYGELASAPERVERVFFRQGGLVELARRMDSGELRPDRGPRRAHPTGGATLLTARPPLVAFNLELDTQSTEVARKIAASLRESGGGLPGVRAIGLPLAGRGAQVSTNIHDPIAVPLVRVIKEVRRLAKAEGAAPMSAELVGLAPAAALEEFPGDLPAPGFDPVLQVIEHRVRQERR